MLNPFPAASALLLLVAAPAAGADSGARDRPGAMVAMQQMVIQVPRMTVTRTTMITRTPRAPTMMVERKADDCIRLDKIVGFMVTQRDSIELLLTDGGRLRARLGSDCPALDFYRGAYVKPHKDGRMCVKRDAIRSRSGGTCFVEGFRKLVPAR